VCSTQDVPAHARRDYWRAVIDAAFPGLAVDWLVERPIRARLETRSFADAQVTEISNMPVKVARTPRGSAADSYQLVLHLNGSGSYAHAGRDIVQNPGDLVLLDTAMPFVSAFDVDFRVLIWELPRQTVAPLLARPGLAVASHISGLHGLGAVLASQARIFAREASLFDASAQRSLRLQLCSLIALVLGAAPAAGESTEIAHRDVRRQQIFAYIETHLRDGRLTAERAARDLKMSRRWLYSLLDDAELSFAHFVARRRVEECYKQLNDPVHDHRSIADIAFACGFNELSTFNRQFRARYGMTPRDARQSRHR
jgi:AraC-like DNA-binding protein